MGGQPPWTFRVEQDLLLPYPPRWSTLRLHEEWLGPPRNLGHHPKAVEFEHRAAIQGRYQMKGHSHRSSIWRLVVKKVLKQL